MTLAWRTYRFVAPCLGAVAPSARMFLSGPEARLWSERLGFVRPEAPCHAWVHAASLGETLGVSPFVSALQALQPDAGVHLTATTRGGRARLAAHHARVTLAPLDAPQTTGRFLNRLRPQRLMLVETELWPHWLLAARARRIPVAVVSARLSERSLSRYQGFGAPFRALVGGLAAVLCQSDEQVERWLRLGAPAARTAATGNLKVDALPEGLPDRMAARTAAGLDRERPLLVLGSLRPGEARVLARALRAVPEPVRQEWQIVAVPRHPRASAELRAEAAAAGQRVASGRVAEDGAWGWDDRLGVLGGLYAAADVAFVGGSLMAAYAGHNPLEPAACGAAVLMGPHHASQRDGVRVLRARGGIWIAAQQDELTAAFVALLGNATVRAARGGAARAAVDAERGAAARTVARLAAWNLWPAA